MTNAKQIFCRRFLEVLDRNLIEYRLFKDFCQEVFEKGGNASEISF